MLRPACFALLLLPGLCAAGVPLAQGLTVTTAIAEADGDYESHKRLEAREDAGWRLRYDASVPQAGGKPRPVSSERILHDEDLQSARTYRTRFEDNAEEDYPGTTALGASTEALEELKSVGKARFAVVGEDQVMASALGLASALITNYNLSFKGELTRKSSTSLRVIVNGEPRDLPALVAAGHLTAKNGQALDAELSFLDDPANPIALQWRMGAANLRVVRIDFPTPRSELAQNLKARKRVTLPGLLFDFGSASLRPESQTSLPAVLEAIRSVPDAALRLEGHTDNIGDAQRNQNLSLARAKAVGAALIQLDPSLASRLKVQGFGASVPVASNTTLEGRAQNRRVELVIP